MPTINIPPHARFVLYIVGALALLFVAYAVDKSWAGDAEVRLVTGLAALLNLLAAAKTDLEAGPDLAELDEKTAQQTRILDESEQRLSNIERMLRDSDPNILGKA